MNPEKQRIKIAEVCGYKRQDVDSPWWDDPTDSFQLHEDDLPDYLNDLNSMREAEIACLTTPDQHRSRRFNLITVVSKTPLGPTESIGWRYEQATADQKAEALLKTLNLWEE